MASDFYKYFKENMEARCAMGGTTISDILWVATHKGIHPPYLHSTLIRYPRITPKARRGVTNFSGPR